MTRVSSWLWSCPPPGVEEAVVGAGVGEGQELTSRQVVSECPRDIQCDACAQLSVVSDGGRFRWACAPGSHWCMNGV
jgi:hypothetical protein